MIFSVIYFLECPTFRFLSWNSSRLFSTTTIQTYLRRKSRRYTWERTTHRSLGYFCINLTIIWHNIGNISMSTMGLFSSPRSPSPDFLPRNFFKALWSAFSHLVLLHKTFTGLWTQMAKKFSFSPVVAQEWPETAIERDGLSKPKKTSRSWSTTSRCPTLLFSTRGTRNMQPCATWRAADLSHDVSWPWWW